MRLLSIFLLVVLIFQTLDVTSQCAGFSVNQVTTTNVSCHGGNDGSITVTTTGGLLPYLYSIGGTGNQLLGTESFDNPAALATGTSTTSKFWSPSTCSTGGLSWDAGSGCAGGAVGFSGSWNNFYGCFLRTPEVNASGLKDVVLKFDISHSYSATTPGNRIRFYAWDNNFSSGSHYYPASSIKINGLHVGITDINGMWLYYTELRTCVEVEVIFDLATIPNDDKLLFYLEPGSGYNNSHVFYTWLDNISISSGVDFQSSNQFTGLQAGLYDVVVEDSNGCVAIYTSNPVAITEPDTLTVTLSVNDVTTPGGSNATAQANVSGGVSGYTYSWSDGTPGFNPAGVFDLAAGQICVTVTDMNNCVSVICDTVNEPDCSNLNYSTVFSADVTCWKWVDGSIVINVAGGVEPIHYSIDGGANFQSNNTFTGLSADSYTLVIEDAGGCIKNYGSNVIITQPLPMTINALAGDITIPGGTNGFVNLNVNGGSLPYSFLWSNGDTVKDITGLSADTYCVTVIDGNHCDTSTTCVDVIDISCSSFVFNNVITNNVTCYGTGDANITIENSGGISPILFSIDNGNNFQSNNGTFTNLLPGNYNLVMNDASGCSINYPDNPVLITEPTAYNPIITQDGNALTASAGSGYQWYLNGNPIAGAVSRKYTTKENGQYYVRITYDNGCEENSPALDIVVSSVESMQILNVLKVYPNPATNQLNVEWGLAQEAGVKIEVLDLYGRGVFGYTFIPLTGSMQIIDIKSLPQGFYWIKFHVGDNYSYRKFIKS